MTRMRTTIRYQSANSITRLVTRVVGQLAPALDEVVEAAEDDEQQCERRGDPARVPAPAG